MNHAQVYTPERLKYHPVSRSSDIYKLDREPDISDEYTAAHIEDIFRETLDIATARVALRTLSKRGYSLDELLEQVGVHHNKIDKLKEERKMTDNFQIDPPYVEWFDIYTQDGELKQINVRIPIK